MTKPKTVSALLTEVEMIFRAIRDYEPREVAKDAFAYDRMVEAYRDAARKGIAALREVPVRNRGKL